jgi:hypothetical protein
MDAWRAHAELGAGRSEGWSAWQSGDPTAHVELWPDGSEGQRCPVEWSGSSAGL